VARRVVGLVLVMVVGLTAVEEAPLGFPWVHVVGSVEVEERVAEGMKVVDESEVVSRAVWKVVPRAAWTAVLRVAWMALGKVEAKGAGRAIWMGANMVVLKVV